MRPDTPGSARSGDPPRRTDAGLGRRRAGRPAVDEEWARGPSAGQVRHQPRHHRHDADEQEGGQEAEPEGYGGPDADPARGVLAVGAGPGGQLVAQPLQGVRDRVRRCGRTGPACGPAGPAPGPARVPARPPRGRPPARCGAAGSPTSRRPVRGVPRRPGPARRPAAARRGPRRRATRRRAGAPPAPGPGAPAGPASRPDRGRTRPPPRRRLRPPARRSRRRRPSRRGPPTRTRAIVAGGVRPGSRAPNGRAPRTGSDPDRPASPARQPRRRRPPGAGCSSTDLGREPLDPGQPGEPEPQPTGQAGETDGACRAGSRPGRRPTRPRCRGRGGAGRPRACAVARADASSPRTTRSVARASRKDSATRRSASARPCPVRWETCQAAATRAIPSAPGSEAARRSAAGTSPP